MLNKLADDFIETVKTELNWFRQNPKLLIPFIFMLATFFGTYHLALSFVEKSAGESSFFMQLVDVSLGYLTFNLLYFPAVAIINLWVLNLLKQHHAQQPLDFVAAFFNSIGLKFFMLIPLMFVWMFFQMIFAVLFTIIAIGIGLTRGSMGKGAIGKLFHGITIVSIMLQALLFVTTPGMVFDDLGSIASFRAMRRNMKKHFALIQKKVFHLGFAFLLAYMLVFHYPGKLMENQFHYYPLYGACFLLLAFIYLIQIKAGTFYLKCRNELSQPDSPASSAQETVASSVS